MKSPFQAMLTDFDEGESHFSQADLDTSTWEWRQFLLSMTDQDLTGGKNSSSTAPNCSSKYSNHENFWRHCQTLYNVQVLCHDWKFHSARENDLLLGSLDGLLCYSSGPPVFSAGLALTFLQCKCRKTGVLANSIKPDRQQPPHS